MLCIAIQCYKLFFYVNQQKKKLCHRKLQKRVKERTEKSVSFTRLMKSRGWFTMFISTVHVPSGEQDRLSSNAMSSTSISWDRRASLLISADFDAALNACARPYKKRMTNQLAWSIIYGYEKTIKRDEQVKKFKHLEEGLNGVNC